jgi:pimeloyl-ACP methyl ester carboxylesterase
MIGEVTVGGLRIGYERAGEGPPLLLLQGFVGDGPRTWRRQIDDLSDEFTVIAWDAPGAGRSSDPPESFRLPDYADCIAGFLAALGLRRAHIVGLSIGGAMALEFYRRYPGVPMTLVLAGAYAGWAGSLPPDVAAQRLQRSLDVSELPPREFADALLPTMFSKSTAPAVVTEFAAALSDFHPAGFRTMAHASAEADLRDVLPQIKVPTLLLYGDQDERAPLTVAAAMQAAIPTATLVLLPGIGHVSSVEAAERFNAEVRAFLRRVGSS